MNTLPLYDINGKQVEKIDISKDFFNEKVNTTLLHQATTMYQANSRQGTSSTKDRSEVRGGGAKPWRQKGTGRARAGSSRSPIWRHGGVTFGPKPRDYSYSMPKKMKLIALQSGINEKIQSKDLLIIQELSTGEPKTKELASLKKSLKIKGKTLLVTEVKNSPILKTVRNIPLLDIIGPKEVNALDLLKHAKIIITKSSFKHLIGRFSK